MIVLHKTTPNSIYDKRPDVTSGNYIHRYPYNSKNFNSSSTNKELTPTESPSWNGQKPRTLAKSADPSFHNLDWYFVLILFSAVEDENDI